MCNYKRVFANKPSDSVRCNWANVYKSGVDNSTGAVHPDFPIDSNGYCLFHSEDIEWKREQDFWQYLLICIGILGKREQEISMYSFHIIGEPDEALIQVHGEATDQDVNSISLTTALVPNKLRFFETVFHDQIHIERCIFRRGITLQDCAFKKGINVFASSFGAEMSISNSVFRRNLSFWSHCEFFGSFSLLDCIFEEKMDFCQSIFKTGASIDGNQFKGQEEPVLFEAVMEEGFSFRSNRSQTLVLFSNCVFFGDNLFYNNILSQFHLERPVIQGSVAFVGTEQDLLFNANAVIELNPESYGEQGQVIFDYCNLLNLGSEFLSNAQELETNQKATILPSCRIDRLTIVYTYPYSRMNRWILGELSNLIGQYFEYYFSINLKIDIQRIVKQGIIKLILKTSEKISEEELRRRFDEMPKKLSVKTEQDDVYPKLMKAKYEELIRLAERIGKSESSTIDPYELISLNGDIHSKSAPARISVSRNEESSEQGTVSLTTKLRMLIKESKIKQCLSLLEENLQEIKEPEDQKLVIAQMAMFANLNKQQSFGLIDIFEYSRQLAQITYNLLGIVEGLEG